ncbi:hypothetical protein CKO09_08635 [Chromatium weissei]|nr:hypothetical protein [Chromatium weissei]
MRTVNSDFLLDVFGVYYPPLRKLFFRLGYKDVKSCVVTIAEMSFSQYLRLLVSASQDIGNQQPLNEVQLLTTVCDTQESLKKYSTEFENAVSRSQLDSSMARRERLRVASKKPKTVKLVSFTFQRNPDVVGEVLEKAHGHCQRCGKPAPFLRKTDHSPYLEVHHIKPLAENGEDTIENAIALCPNCHRELHYGESFISIK